MAIALAPFREGLAVSIIRLRVEHAGVSTIAGYSVPFEINDVLGEWSRAEALAVVAYDAAHDHDATSRRSQRQRQRDATAAPEPGPGSACAMSETAAGVAGLVKALLVLKCKQIPANLHFETPNPNIDFEKLKLRVNQKR